MPTVAGAEPFPKPSCSLHRPGFVVAPHQAGAPAATAAWRFDL